MTEQRVLTADQSALLEKGIERLLALTMAFCMSTLGGEPIFSAWVQELTFASEYALWRDFPALACIDIAERYQRVAEAVPGLGQEGHVNRIRARLFRAGACLMAVETETLSDTKDPGKIVCEAVADLAAVEAAMIRLDAIDKSFLDSISSK